MFPNMREAISEVVYECLDELLTETKGFMTRLMQVQMKYINTQHPDFQKGWNLVRVQAHFGTG